MLQLRDQRPHIQQGLLSSPAQIVSPPTPPRRGVLLECPTGSSTSAGMLERGIRCTLRKMGGSRRGLHSSMGCRLSVDRVTPSRQIEGRRQPNLHTTAGASSSLMCCRHVSLSGLAGLAAERESEGYMSLRDAVESGNAGAEGGWAVW
jgi:hypothetical protein